jgi:hypothetical protein
LITAHKILIAAAALLALGFAVRSALNYTAHHRPADGALSLLALAVATVLTMYLSKLRRR